MHSYVESRQPGGLVYVMFSTTGAAMVSQTELNTLDQSMQHQHHVAATVASSSGLYPAPQWISIALRFIDTYFGRPLWLLLYALWCYRPPPAVCPVPD